MKDIAFTTYCLWCFVFYQKYATLQIGVLKNKPKVLTSVLLTTMFGAGAILASGIINSRSMAPRTSVATYTQAPTPTPSPTGIRPAGR